MSWAMGRGSLSQDEMSLKKGCVTFTHLYLEVTFTTKIQIKLKVTVNGCIVRHRFFMGFLNNRRNRRGQRLTGRLKTY